MRRPPSRGLLYARLLLLAGSSTDEPDRAADCLFAFDDSNPLEIERTARLCEEVLRSRPDDRLLERAAGILASVTCK